MSKGKRPGPGGRPRADRADRATGAGTNAPGGDGAGEKRPPQCWCGQTARPPFCDGSHSRVELLQAGDGARTTRPCDDQGPLLARRAPEPQAEGE